MRTLEDIERDLALAREELQPLQEARDVAVKKVNSFYYEKKKYILDHGMFHPISELENYIGRKIDSIDLVERMEDGSLDTDRMYNDEMFSIDENGHLCFSSYDSGVMDFDEKLGKYVMWCHFHRTEHDYVGYLDLELEDDD